MADFCPYCGKQLTEEGVMFCPFCGKSMKEEEPVQSAQNSQSAFQQAPPETEEAYEQIFSDKESAERYYDSLNDRYGSGERETSNREYFRPNSWDRGVFRSNALGKPKN
ncbi:MAG: zinc ribbon domain-containing protein, partial [Eubacteriaceae bacterium]|nr:zinc ribbon domain-containing protein [Eubacteriaceae bacterium]